MCYSNSTLLYELNEQYKYWAGSLQRNPHKIIWADKKSSRFLIFFSIRKAFDWTENHDIHENCYTWECKWRKTTLHSPSRTVKYILQYSSKSCVSTFSNQWRWTLIYKNVLWNVWFVFSIESYMGKNLKEELEKSHVLVKFAKLCTYLDSVLHVENALGSKHM